MATGEQELIVLRDNRGNTYLLDRRALNEVLVPEEHRAEVEEALQGRQLSGGAMRLDPSETEFEIVGSFNLLRAGGVQLAQTLRAA